MNPNSEYLSSAEAIVIEAFRKECDTYGRAKYEQALVNVSGILVWLTSKPKISAKKLTKYVLAEFDKAIAKGACKPDSTIAEHVAFCRKTFGEK